MLTIAYVVIGILAGSAMGFFGIAGGIIVVPGLMYLAGLSQKVASGTNLLILTVPVSFAAALSYYKTGNVNIRAAVTIAIVMCVTAWASSRFALKMNADILRLAFGVFVIIMGFYICLPVVFKLTK